MEEFVMYMSYAYKDSLNYSVTLRKNKENDNISVVTTYGEIVAICKDAYDVARVLKNLGDDKYL